MGGTRPLKNMGMTLNVIIFLCVAYLYPPLSPAPSANISSSSGVAPPVISDRINVKAFWLK